MPKVGNGDIATILPDRDDLLFFASGVSNSQETRQSEYDREAKLLMEQDRLAHLVYFSSLAIFYSDTPYTRHKRAMEVKIKQWFPTYTIIRLGNIDWGTNPHTIINHLKHQLYNGEELRIQDVYRHVISKQEFLHWVNLIPDWNCEMNCPGRMMHISEIVKEIKEGKL